MKEKIVIVDDETRLAEVLAMVLKREGYQVSTYSNPTLFLKEMGTIYFDLVITDLKMPEVSGIDILAAVKKHDATIPVILITAHATVATAIDAMKKGAFDYIEKPFDNESCVSQVSKALDYSRIDRENKYLRQELKSRYHLNNFIIVSKPMQEVFDIIKKAAKSQATVLIHGASGTGKELMARSIHYYSDRIGKPFMAVNCKALSTGVLESELFGHEKGAYTGASATKKGLFEQADGGTVFLDEIGEIDENFQGKLLRVLQEKEVQRVGSQKAHAIDVRIVCATNKDLQQEMKEGRFREDLYFRLAVIPITIPPVADRKDDILPLARFFIQKYGQELGKDTPTLSPEAEKSLQAYSWPGNVRELENSMERALVLMQGDQLEPENFMIASGQEQPQAGSGHTLAEQLDHVTKKIVKNALQESGGVRVDAAARLGVERTTLYRLIKKYQLES